MYNNLPDCMYDYRPSIYGEENNSIDSDTYCERCGGEITEEEYQELDGYCLCCHQDNEYK